MSAETVDRLNAALDGRYRVERKLGEGGMATVYLAQDERHNRSVALKVLKPELAAVVGAERFLAEIETTAKLQHPHILPLFDSGEADGYLFYVMPYVEGETLRDRLDRERQLPVDEALGIATAVAHALQAAHDEGIVHRDIKPGNILLSRGEPLVADFGIALAVGGASGTRLTETGLSIGTPYYMSPEQATGDQAVGPSSDTFALGCVLYEMLVGEPPYPGATAQAVLGKIIQGAPVSATAVRKSIPLNVDAAIRKALEKLPADRFREAEGFAKALADPAFRYGEGGVTGGLADIRWRRAAYGLATTSIVLALLSGWALTRSDPPEPTVRASIVLPEPRGGVFGTMALSRDGSLFVYEGPAEGGEGVSQLWVRRWNELHAQPVPGTEGGISPSLSPDGREVAFVNASRQLMIASLEGGVPRVVAEPAGWGGDWARDGFIYFTESESRGLARVPDDGGSVELLTEPAEGETGHFSPFRLEDDDLVLFESLSSGGYEIRAVDLSSDEIRTVAPAGAKPRYMATGHLVYVTPGGELVAAPFDPGSMEATGLAVPLARDVAYSLTQPVEWALSESGTVVYPTGMGSSRFQAVWVDRNGASTPVDPGWSFDPGNNNRGLAIAPDGSRLAVTVRGEVAEDIWIKELPRGPLARLTVDSAQDVRPQWTGDGRVTFISERGAPPAKVYARRADGTGGPELLMEHETPIWEAVTSGDGAWLLARTGGTVSQTGGRDVLALRLGEDGAEPSPLIVTGFDEKAITLSPDDRWLAYESDETGRNEIYVRPFPDVDAGKWAVSVNGGVMPLWSPDGGTIFYVSGTNEMVEARITTEPSFDVAQREVLFTIGPDFLIPQNEQYTLYDVTPDGERFIMLRQEESEETEVILITNWLQEVEERVPR